MLFAVLVIVVVVVVVVVVFVSFCGSLCRSRRAAVFVVRFALVVSVVLAFFVRSLIVAVVYGAFIVVVRVALVAAAVMVRTWFLVRHTVFLVYLIPECSGTHVFMHLTGAVRLCFTTRFPE